LTAEGPVLGIVPALERIGFRPERTEDESFLCRLYASTRTGEMALTGWTEEQKESFLRQQFQFQTLHYRRYYTGASFPTIRLRDSTSAWDSVSSNSAR